MRPIHLKLKGINSYVSEQCVDFGKLAESCMFGIFGETGSGKSTILDSIIIALYGSSDRDLNANLINVNANSALVEFVFEIYNHGQSELYRVTRQFKVRNSGLKADAVLDNLNKSVTIAEGVEQVNAAILKILGIGKREFLKCIALPQNEFDKFLMDTPSDRKKSIAKLFNVENFGVKLNEKVKDKKFLLQNKQNLLEEKLKVYGSIASESESELEIKKLALTKTIKQNQTLFEKNKKNYENYKTELDNYMALDDINNRLNNSNIQQESINQLKQLVEYSAKNGEAAQKIVDLNCNINNLNKELQKLESQKQKLAKQFESALNNKNAVEQEMKMVGQSVANEVRAEVINANMQNINLLNNVNINKTQENEKQNIVKVKNNLILQNKKFEKEIEIYSKSNLNYSNKSLEELQQKNKELQTLLDNITEELKENKFAILNILERLNLAKTELNGIEQQGLKIEQKILKPAQLITAQKQIGTFEKEKNYLQMEQAKLQKLVGNKKRNKLELKEIEQQLKELEKELLESKSDLAVVNNTLKNLQEIKKQQKQVNKDLAQVNKELNIVLELSKQISNNALIDFVSEEYLHLVTEFSNKFVYKISKGKYFLNYDGNEFVVIDNFNGGNLRSVKTLSGGERFIISLSLALGVSQTIAANSNHSFNFFFIDEGFGNLSENYVDSVISCFDSLIKLNFTVGFISHVDKMEDYLTNKLVVEKPNSEIGSIIHQMF